MSSMAMGGIRYKFKGILGCERGREYSFFIGNRRSVIGNLTKKDKNGGNYGKKERRKYVFGRSIKKPG